MVSIHTWFKNYTLWYEYQGIKKKWYQRGTKYEFECIDLVCDASKQMQLFAQVEENKSFEWTEGNQHKHKIDLQRFQVEGKRKSLMNHCQAERKHW